jgi:hypothetical protein
VRKLIAEDGNEDRHAASATPEAVPGCLIPVAKAAPPPQDHAVLPVISFRRTCVAGLLALAACGSKAPDKPVERPIAETAETAAPVAAPSTNQPDMALLRSAALKDAIHRALTSGKAERWADGALSGYAVPSLESLPNGCRTVRYTVDQRPDAPMMTINACEGSR